MNQAQVDRLSRDERAFLNHAIRWGSDGYPIVKVKGRTPRWLWYASFGIKGSPKVYKTKREAEAAVEAYIDVLLDKSAGRI